MLTKSNNTSDTVAVADIKTIVVNSLSLALHEKCDATAAHCRRVAQQSIFIGCTMGLRNNELSLLERAALLHDIGKLIVERSYIHKPGRLTADEWKEMKRHPEIGAAILKPYPFFNREAHIALTHHERYDGKGYPKNVEGDCLSIHSCIIAVADTIDAMTAGRAYRSTVTLEEVVEELKRERGKQFHPRVVDTFITEVITQHDGSRKRIKRMPGEPGMWHPKHLSCTFPCCQQEP